ncbi:MAG: SulP family inorganic anion transporter [Polyangiaceae bacterium]|nr:SulP family inorganic anion transporter [Polyangiaceae bacterium]
MKDESLFSSAKADLPAAIVVFLVALPLCLGIALASGAPPIAGLIAGITGGIIVGAISQSPLGVSGPAAGLAVIVLNAIDALGAYELFLVAVIIAGVLQVVFGILRAGVLAYYFPSSVIQGMLSGIGIIILLKQIPHAVGYNRDYEGSVQFMQSDGENSFSALSHMLSGVNAGSIAITFIGLGLMLLWERPIIRQSKIGMVPGPLLAVLGGGLLAKGFQGQPGWALGQDFYVELPEFSLDSLDSLVTFPNFSGLTSPDVWMAGATMAIVASLETLLCVEATDKLDPLKRTTPTNRELVAQGSGNIISGLLGGLPVTQVIVRSSANIQSGGRTRLSAIAHGFLLLLSLLFVPDLLRLIPLASLAAILLIVGYKLAKPHIFVAMWKKGAYQFAPFLVTVAGVVLTDLLTGVVVGLVVGFIAVLYHNYRVSFHFDASSYVPGEPIVIELSENVSFLNKAAIKKTLGSLPAGVHVIIDGSRNVSLDPDVQEIIENTVATAEGRRLQIELIGFDGLEESDQASHDSIQEVAEAMAQRPSRRLKRQSLEEGALSPVSTR